MPHTSLRVLASPKGWVRRVETASGEEVRALSVTASYTAEERGTVTVVLPREYVEWVTEDEA